MRSQRRHHNSGTRRYVGARDRVRRRISAAANSRGAPPAAGTCGPRGTPLPASRYRPKRTFRNASPLRRGLHHAPDSPLPCPAPDIPVPPAHHHSGPNPDRRDIRATVSTGWSRPRTTHLSRTKCTARAQPHRPDGVARDAANGRLHSPSAAAPPASGRVLNAVARARNGPRRTSWQPVVGSETRGTIPFCEPVNSD